MLKIMRMERSAHFHFFKDFPLKNIVCHCCLVLEDFTEFSFIAHEK